MNVPNGFVGSALRGAMVLPVLMSRGAHAAVLDTALARAQGIAGAVKVQTTFLFDALIARTQTLSPHVLQFGLIASSALAGAIAIWLLVRRPRRHQPRAELDLAFVAQPLPDRSAEAVDLDGRGRVSRAPRLLEAVAAMKAQATLGDVYASGELAGD